MSIFSFLKSHAVLASTICIVIVAGAVITGRIASRPAVGLFDSNMKRVAVVPVSSFSTGTGVVSADGIVKSVAQVDLRSQLSAPISHLAVALGDNVYAGQTIAELSNADIRAQLDQAKLSLSLEGISLDSARKTAVDAVESSYLNADEVVHTQIDPMLFNSTMTSVQLSAFSTDAVYYQQILAMRTDITNLFNSWKGIVNGLETASDASLSSALETSQANIEKIRTLLDEISKILNSAAIIALPADLVKVNSWKTTVTAARSSMSAVGTALINAKKALSSSLVSQGGTGAAPGTIAQAGVKNLQAQLDKTIIRSPIAGKVAALPLRSGEFAGPGQLIATIVGAGSLEIQAFVSAEDISRISIGAEATVDGNISGKVSNISPSVNPVNKRVEVKILVSSETPGLIIGRNVSASIKAAAAEASTTSVYNIPIQNIRIVPGDAYVFTVDESSKVVKHRVTLGEVKGDFVQVIAGINSDMKIVSPVYELEEGQTVEIE